MFFIKRANRMMHIKQLSTASFIGICGAAVFIQTPHFVYVCGLCMEEALHVL